MANDIYLYAKDPGVNPQDNFMGKLIVKQFNVAQSTDPGCVQIYLECSPNLPFYAGSNIQWAWLEAKAWTNRVPPRDVGAVEIPTDQRPPTVKPGAHQIRWGWRLVPNDIELVESTRDPAANPVVFKLDVRGILQRGTNVVTVEGDGQFEISVPDRERHIKQLGYAVPPSQSRDVGLSATTHPSWAEAAKRLEAARRHLRAGEAYLALTSCLDQFSSLVPMPYMESKWLAILPEEPSQKRESAARLLAAHCTYLNRVGYHRERSRPDTQDLQPMPLQQWEAELATAQSQALLAFALRHLGKV